MCRGNSSHTVCVLSNKRHASPPHVRWAFFFHPFAPLTPFLPSPFPSLVIVHPSNPLHVVPARRDDGRETSLASVAFPPSPLRPSAHFYPGICVRDLFSVSVINETPWKLALLLYRRRRRLHHSPALVRKQQDARPFRLRHRDTTFFFFF